VPRAQRVNSAFAVILSRTPRVLVVQKRNGAWSLPGGTIERGESPRRAVLREVREETGLSGRRAELVGRVRRSRGRAFLFVLQKRRTKGALRGPTREIRRQRWLGPKAALRLLSGRHATRLEKALPHALRLVGR
jgi:8-oxo-dGTP diphosphatase